MHQPCEKLQDRNKQNALGVYLEGARLQLSHCEIYPWLLVRFVPEELRLKV